MADISFEDKVRSVDWAKYLEPEYYNPKTMSYNPANPVKALIRLSRFSDLENASSAEDLTSELRFAFGNDHRGTYYPAALEAIDLIIEVLEHSKLRPAQNCARGVLNDLYYFQLELGSDDQQLYDAIESTIREKLHPFSDENLKSYFP